MTDDELIYQKIIFNNVATDQHVTVAVYFCSSALACLVVSHPGSVKLQWPDALSLCMWRGAAALPSELPPPARRAVKVDIGIEAGFERASVFPSLSRDCVRGTKGRAEASGHGEPSSGHVI